MAFQLNIQLIKNQQYELKFDRVKTQIKAQNVRTVHTLRII